MHCMYAVVPKKWAGEHEWQKRPKVHVAVQVNSQAVRALCYDLMSA
jgi:hypothetical protein